jgi:hypothetical protein
MTLWISLVSAALAGGMFLFLVGFGLRSVAFGAFGGGTRLALAQGSATASKPAKPGDTSRLFGPVREAAALLKGRKVREAAPETAAPDRARPVKVSSVELGQGGVAADLAAANVTPIRRRPREASMKRPPEVQFVQDILVPRSAVEAAPADPMPLVQAVVDYCNALTERGFYRREEMNPAIHQAYYTDFYAAEIEDFGHAGFIQTARVHGLLDVAMKDVILGLRAMGAEPYEILARATHKWLRDVGAEEQRLERLDGIFLKLDKAAPLRGVIARWLADHPDLRIVEDEAWPEQVEAICAANPERARRKGARRRAGAGVI